MFIYGRPLVSEEFLGRRKEVRQIRDHILKKESVAVIGQPHMGKTSLCNYLMDSNVRATLLGEKSGGYIFSYIDAHIFMGSSITRIDFWKEALKPLRNSFELNTRKDSTLFRFFRTVANNYYSNTSLSELFRQLQRMNLCFVIIIDEFDALINHEAFRSADFFGGLRSLSSTTQGLVFIIASRQSLSTLDKLTEEFSFGSPYFNTFVPIFMKSLPPDDCKSLLEKGAGASLLSTVDIEFIAALAGGHPYLTQLTAQALVETIEDGQVDVAKYRTVAHMVLNRAESHFNDVWRTWSNGKRKAFTIVALLDMPRLLTKREFDLHSLKHGLDNVEYELNELTDEGVISRTDNSRYCISQRALLWWLADELIRQIRDEDSFEKWLRNQQLEGGDSQQQRERLTEITKHVLTVVSQGATTLITAFAQGFGEAAGKSVGGTP